MRACAAAQMASQPASQPVIWLDNNVSARFHRFASFERAHLHAHAFISGFSITTATTIRVAFRPVPVTTFRVCGHNLALRTCADERATCAPTLNQHSAANAATQQCQVHVMLASLRPKIAWRRRRRRSCRTRATRSKPRARAERTRKTPSGQKWAHNAIS